MWTHLGPLHPPGPWLSAPGHLDFFSSALAGKLSLLPTANSDAFCWQADKAAQFPYPFLLTSSTYLLAHDILFSPLRFTFVTLLQANI